MTATTDTDRPDRVDGSTSARVLRTAAALFREKGYFTTSMRELASRLGIQKASLYHHLTSKEALLFDICKGSLARITEEVGRAATAAEPPQRINAMARAHLVTALQDQDLHAVMLAELRGLSPRHRATTIAGRDRYEQLLREAIETDQAAGRMRNDIEAKYLTLALLSMLNWTIFWFDEHHDRSAEELAAMFADIHLRGAGPVAPDVPEDGAR